MTLGQRWSTDRPPVLGLHLDSAACSRQSIATLRAVAQHAEYEAQIGGYVAQEAAVPVLDAGRAALRQLAGMSAARVTFTTGGADALIQLLQTWPGDQGKVIACLPGEFGPSLVIMRRFGFTPVWLPVDGQGRADLAGIESLLRRERIDVVHFTMVASHRGILQPGAQVVKLCRDVGVPVIVDAAQALGHVDCSFGADALYAPSRKWLAGPRGVGVLLTDRVLEHLRWPWADHVEAHVAGWVGLSVAVGEHMAAGAEQIRSELVSRGQTARQILGAVKGWRVVEDADESTAIVTLEPSDADVAATRQRLLEEHSILTTAAEIVRAPFEMTKPVLRMSPHVDTTDEDLVTFGAALSRTA